MKRCLILLIALLLHAAAWAHKPSDSYLTLRGTEGSEDIAGTSRCATWTTCSNWTATAAAH